VAYFGLAGVVPYLTWRLSGRPGGDCANAGGERGEVLISGCAGELSAVGRKAFDALAGEWLLQGSRFSFSYAGGDGGELREAVWRVEQVDSDGLNEIYFKDRADGLKLSAVKLGCW